MTLRRSSWTELQTGVQKATEYVAVLTAHDSCHFQPRARGVGIKLPAQESQRQKNAPERLVNGRGGRIAFAHHTEREMEPVNWIMALCALFSATLTHSRGPRIRHVLVLLDDGGNPNFYQILSTSRYYLDFI